MHLRSPAPRSNTIVATLAGGEEVEEVEGEAPAEAHGEAVEAADDSEVGKAKKTRKVKRVKKTKKDRLVQLATGALYDPVTDSWRPMNSDGAPRAREDHVAVWVGDSLLVWGGRNGKDTLASGGRYDPSTDRWHGISISEAEPAPRWNHTAVFTGEQVIIWGGFARGYDAAGARYLP